MKLKIVGAALLTAAFALSAVGCQKGVRPGGESVVQIRAWKAGFGDEWLNAAVDEFNKMYADEGYSAKIEESAGTITTEEVVSQTKDYKKNNIDLYFASGSAAILELVDASAQILRTSDYTLLEDLSDVYESGAIGFNKQVETESIESKISDSADYFLAYNGKVDKWKGTRFLYQWTSASSGFVYNKKVVDSYLGGEVPRTTNELKVAFDKILSEGKADNVYPVAWGGNNAAGYWQYVTETWFAQYAGEDDYYDFYRLKPESGDTIKEGWKVYDNKGWLYAFENLETFCDSGYAAPGTLTTVDNLGAQDLLLKGKAAFCTSGDWMYNEMCNDPSYEKYLPDIRIMRVPVMSQLGEKLKLHSNPDTCDKILSEVIKGVDENKTDEEIISAVRSAYSVTLDGAQVEEIRAARGIYYDLGYQHVSYIPYHSDTKEAAKLFLRFIASNDFQGIYREKAHGNLPYDYTEPEGEEINAYQESLDVLTHSENSTQICEANQLSEIRAAAGITSIPYINSWVTLVKGLSAGTYAADNIYENNLKSVSGDNWTFLLNVAGIS